MPEVPVIVIHGGAGTLLRSKMSSEKELEYRQALEFAVDSGFHIIKNGGSALDGACAAVEALENSPLFNAGKGSVFNSSGEHEMEASVMRGDNRMAGAVSLLKNVKNPVLLAKEIMENTEHVMLAGQGAEEFARIRGLSFETDEYFHNQLRYEQWQSIKGSSGFQLDHSDDKNKNLKMGTVGAVAVDKDGNIASATSTGGMTNKFNGRIGDTPLIGAGTYANNLTCAVSCTGSGEFFMRGVTAYDVSCLIEYKGMSLQEACREVIHKRTLELGGDGGLIAVNSSGEFAMEFNTLGMYRAWKTGTDNVGVEIFKTNS